MSKEQTDQEKAQKAYLESKTKNNKELFFKLQKEAKDQEAQRKEAKKRPKGKTVKLTALVNLSGRFNLPYSEGDDFSINEKQAEELIKEMAAEEAK